MGKRRTSGQQGVWGLISGLVILATLSACASSGGGSTPTAESTPSPESTTRVESSASAPTDSSATSTASAEGASSSSAAADVAAPSPGGATSEQVQALLADPAAVSTGRQYFRAVCTGYCHTTQAGVKREAPDLFDCDWKHGGQDEDLFRTVSEGVPNTEMLPFGDKLEADVLWMVIAFVRSSTRCGA